MKKILVEIFGRSRRTDLEDNINTWLTAVQKRTNNNFEMIDIKYSTHFESDAYISNYSAMIIYKVDAE